MKDRITPRPVDLFRSFKGVANILVKLRFGDVTLNISHASSQPLPCSVIYAVDMKAGHGVADEALQHVIEMVPPGLGCLVCKVYANESKFFVQQPCSREIVKRWHEQAPGHVAIGAEYHHCAGITRTDCVQRRRFYRRFTAGLGHFVVHGTIVRSLPWENWLLCREALFQDQSVRDPQYDPQTQSAWPRAFSRRTCVPVGNGTARRVTLLERPPEQLPRWRPRRSSDPHLNPERSPKMFPASDPWPAPRRQDRVATKISRCRASTIQRCPGG